MPQPWSALFQLNRAPLMELNLERIDQVMADRAPAEGLNSIAWILRHVLDCRSWMLEAVFDAPHAPAEAATLPELAAAIAGSQVALSEAFDAVQDWSAVRRHPAIDAPMPLEQIVGTFLTHEAYHLGQLGTARRLLGLPGALKLPAEIHA